jgi:DNA-binding HxlR family transcriptional regulator
MLRSYDQDHCPGALTLGLIGYRWTILILRDLLLEGPPRFQDLQESLRGAAPNTLSARLRRWKRTG